MKTRICSNSEMREIDRIAEVDYLIEPSILMENAGRAAAQVTLEHFPDAGRSSEILVFAGKGNNAGDAFVVARRLICLDRRVRVFHLEAPSGYRGATLKNFQILQKLKAKMTFLESASDLEDFLRTSSGPFTIIDGILGTGLIGNLEGIFYDVVEMINGLKSKEVVALDIPTGVSGDSGQVLGTAIQANVTVSFGFPKFGHFFPPGAGKRGELVNVDISLPARFHKEGDKFLLTREMMSQVNLERDRYGHKNSFGHTLLIGGSPGRLGAILMAARAAMRMGTGLVTIATWEEGLDSLIAKMPEEMMAFPLRSGSADIDFYKTALSNYSSIVIGPGLGLRPEGKRILEELLMHYSGPIVIDADAINLISDYGLHELLLRRGNQTVLTPHPGEMSRLLKKDKDAIRIDPVATLKEAVEKTHCVVVLKGATSLIGSAEGELYLNHYPNDGMARAGSGDVLAGMIGGLLGQKMNGFQSALLGVYLHSIAGGLAAQKFGHRSMVANDVIENISNAFKEIKETVDPQGGREEHIHLL